MIIIWIKNNLNVYSTKFLTDPKHKELKNIHSCAFNRLRKAILLMSLIWSCLLLLFLIILLYPPRAFVSSIRCLSLHKLRNAFYIFLMFNIYYVVYTILNTHESAIGTHVSPTSRIPLPSPCPQHPSRLSQSTGFGYPASYVKLPLAICFMYGYVYVSMLLSQVIPPSPSPSAFKNLFFMSVPPLVPWT